MRLFIVGEVRLYIEGLANVLSSERSVAVLGTGPPDESTLRRIADLKPRAILVDCTAARDVAFLRRALAASLGSGILVVGIKDDEDAVLSCAEAGVAGYIGADASVPELVESLRKVNCGEFTCPATIARILLRHVGASASGSHHPDGFSPRLTRRENDVVVLLDKGLTNKEIAEAMRVEISTVKNHVHHILEKLGVARRGAAVAKLRARTNEHKDLDPRY
jgi:DNA-binding NarL/FixJ family response regulator